MPSEIFSRTEQLNGVWAWLYDLTVKEYQYPDTCLDFASQNAKNK